MTPRKHAREYYACHSCARAKERAGHADAAPRPCMQKDGPQARIDGRDGLLFRLRDDLADRYDFMLAAGDTHDY